MEDIFAMAGLRQGHSEGVAILDRHTKNSALIRHFRCTTAKFAAAKLEYELRKLLKERAAALGVGSLLSRPAPVGQIPAVGVDTA